MVLRLILASILTALGTAPVVAAPLSEPDPAPAGSTLRGPESLEQSAARVLARLALTDLKVASSQGAPTEADFRIAAALLEHAYALDPRESQVLRYLIEAHENSGNSERVVELTRDLLKLEPDDTVAQLRLASAGIRKLQNADDRLAAYDRWLGKEGASIDPSVRSRLALDAALLSREKGDAQGFAQRLSRSIELDGTNKDAATLALAYFQQRVGEPVGEFELMLAVLNADPLDPALHQSIARHLASHGAFQGASRFFNSYALLRGAAGEQPSIDEVTEIEAVRWRIEGPRPLIERYNQGIFEARQAIRRQREDAEKDKRPLDSIPKPEESRLPMSAEWARFLASLSIGDPQLVDSAFDELIESARLESVELGSTEDRPASVSDEEATNRIRGLLEESTAARLLAGKQPEKVAEALDILRGDAAVDKNKLANLEALNLARKGDFDGARQLLEARVETDPAAALAWCAVLEEQASGQGASEQARREVAEALLALARRDPASLPGVFAASRYMIMTGKPFPADPTSKKLDELAAGVPSWVDTMIGNTRRFQALDVQLLDADVKPLEPVRLKITLRNVGPVPLGVGPDRPINTRLLIAPQVQIGTDSVPSGSRLNVISMERRLRLAARSEFSVVVQADAPQLAFLLEQVSGRSCRVRYRVLQGFEPINASTFDAGPHCLVAECGPVRRQVLPKSTSDVPALVRFAETGSARDVAESVLIAQGRAMPLAGMTALSKEELTQLFEAVAKRLPQLSVAGQVLVLSLLPVQGQFPEVAKVDLAAMELPDPMVRSIALATRAKSADLPIFNDPGSRATTALADLTELVQQRLQAGTPCLATYTVEPQPAQPVQDGGGGSAVQPDK